MIRNWVRCRLFDSDQSDVSIQSSFNHTKTTKNRRLSMRAVFTTTFPVNTKTSVLTHLFFSLHRLTFLFRTLLLPPPPSVPPPAARFVAAREIHHRQCSAAAFHQWRRMMLVNRTIARGEFERQRECALRCFAAWKSEMQVTQCMLIQMKSSNHAELAMHFSQKSPINSSTNSF